MRQHERFIAEGFVIGKNLETMEMSFHKWYVHLIDNYRAEKMKELPSYTSAWMNLKHLLVGEKGKS